MISHIAFSALEYVRRYTRDGVVLTKINIYSQKSYTYRLWKHFH